MTPLSQIRAGNPIPRAMDTRQIANLGQRWIAFKEGPFALDAAETIYEDAKADIDRIMGYVRFHGDRIKFFASPSDISPEARRYHQMLEVKTAACGVIDFLNGEDDFDASTIDELEEALFQ